MPEAELDAAPETQETLAPPVPAPSVASGTPSGLTLEDEDRLVAKLTARLVPDLAEQVDKRSQSVKDKRIAGLEKSVAEFAEIAERLKVAGGDPVKAAREYQVDKMLQGGQEFPQSIGGTVDAADLQAETVEILDLARSLGVEIANNDPELAKAAEEMSKRPWKASDWHRQVNVIVANRKKQGTASAAAVAVEGGGKPPGKRSMEDVQSDLANATSTGRPVAEIKKYADELRELINKG